MLSPLDLVKPGALLYTPALHGDVRRGGLTMPRFGHDSAGPRSLWMQMLAQTEATFGNHPR